MNNRQKALLRILLTESEEHHLVQKLAERLDCSEKTVRSDLKLIEEYLQEHSDAKIIRKPGYGVYIEIDEHENTRIFSTLQLADFQEKSEEDHDRLIQTAYHLLMNIKPVTVTELSSRYYVNKAVIKKDLIRLEEWLKKFNLDLITKQKVGLNVEGREKDKRRALARLSEFLQQPERQISFIKTQFSSYELDLVQKELKELQERHSLFFTDEAFEGLSYMFFSSQKEQN
jgi:activator of the mannose operon, transcriptional antiterminator